MSRYGMGGLLGAAAPSYSVAKNTRQVSTLTPVPALGHGTDPRPSRARRDSPPGAGARMLPRLASHGSHYPSRTPASLSNANVAKGLARAMTKMFGGSPAIAARAVGSGANEMRVGPTPRELSCFS